MSIHSLSENWQIRFKGDDVRALAFSFLNNLEYRLGKDRYSATKYDEFLSAAYSAMEHLVERWIITQETYHQENPKRVYYLSMEYLLGRSFENNLINLGLADAFREAMLEIGVGLEELAENEVDAGLGNGGLGRLAACFLDSLATLDIPAHGYGIRYDYGLFHQKIVENRQVETPDNWLALPNPWEIGRPEYIFPVHFGGRTEQRTDADGRTRSVWLDTSQVLAMPYDTPVSGYQTHTVNTLRLWTARATEEFNFDYFNSGDYMAACQNQVQSENITKVLYPNDNFFVGRELRLKQEYFLVSASLQDILRRFKRENAQWTDFPTKVAIHLNDTHPSLAIPELMRILVDEEGLDWFAAWDITVATFGYTNHTVLPEALEEWPVSLIQGLLPRHMEIIYQINHYFLKEVARKHPGDIDRLRRMSLISEEGGQRVRMAYLSVVGSHSVNGVSALHTRLLQETVLHDFSDFWPERFNNKTNGITPRRWLRMANPSLSRLISEAIGDGWTRNLDELRKLEPLADDPEFQAQWRAIKRANKTPLIDLVKNETGTIILPDTLFDVQVKRFHEYKRQLLFALYITATYLRIKNTPVQVVVPRTCLFGGKAAPGYGQAKLIIRFINHIADLINQDPSTNHLLRVAFLPNYRVSLAEKLFPASDLSEQISTAGKEASGTGNMKFALNGAITIGTLDGANIEIMEEVGRDNIFIFGKTADEIVQLKRSGYRPGDYIAASPLLQEVIHLLDCDFFSPGEPGLFRPILDALTIWGDEYCLMADFDSYVAAQDLVSAAYQDPARWTRMSILNVARSGKFSSDRTIDEYAREIWNAPPCHIPDRPLRVCDLVGGGA
jgi:starch phosphorylase